MQSNGEFERRGICWTALKVQDSISGNETVLIHGFLDGERELVPGIKYQFDEVIRRKPGGEPSSLPTGSSAVQSVAVAVRNRNISRPSPSVTSSGAALKSICATFHPVSRPGPGGPSLFGEMKKKQLC